jgi:hypothetical protein
MPVILAEIETPIRPRGSFQLTCLLPMNKELRHLSPYWGSKPKPAEFLKPLNFNELR